MVRIVDENGDHLIDEAGVFAVDEVPNPPDPQALLYGASAPGANIDRITKFAQHRIWTNMMHNCDELISHDGIVFDDSRPITVDADGWVASLLSGQQVTFFLTNQMPENLALAGDDTWVVLYDGDGGASHDALVPKNDLTLVPGSRTAGRFECTMIPTDAGMRIWQATCNAGDPVKNIRVVPKIFEKTFDTTNHYHPNFRASVVADNLTCFRLIELNKTRDNLTTSWANRTRLTNFSWNVDSGVPYEEQIRMCNYFLVDYWPSIPYHWQVADANALGSLVFTDLDTRLRFIPEYINEPWNAQFFWAALLVAAGNIKYPLLTNFEAQLTYYGFYAATLFTELETIFTGDQAYRLNPMLNCQAANEWTGRTMMDAEVTGPTDLAYMHISWLSPAAYIGHGLGDEPQAVTGPAQDHNPDTTLNMTVEQKVASLAVYLDEFLVAGGDFQIHLQNAWDRGIGVCVYETNHHAIGGTTTLQNNADLTAALIELIEADEIEPVLLDFWTRVGNLIRGDGVGQVAGGPLMVFTRSRGHTKANNWGIRRFEAELMSLAPMARAWQAWSSTATYSPMVLITSSGAVSRADGYAVESRGNLMGGFVTFSGFPVAGSPQVLVVRDGPAGQVLREIPLYGDASVAARFDVPFHLVNGLYVSGLSGMSGDEQVDMQLYFHSLGPEPVGQAFPR